MPKSILSVCDEQPCEPLSYNCRLPLRILAKRPRPYFVILHKEVDAMSQGMPTMLPEIFKCQSGALRPVCAI